ncbi:hypothetical protein M404DRAFT_992542 [Pisolithus tinctorius Marx 270]|uniref:Uncharacterized protein n=1 Tax=Pisolithus tinctorius Marx 270 TaxID=870435 RepID=A0A0C3PYI7_PISTI|nr:hypothetical protein M404DRAFT_992542 [Pisolithus tinctorius Marx 270]
MCARQYLERQKISTPGPKLVSCAGYLASRLSAEFRLLITPLMFNHSGLSGARQTLDAYRTYQGKSAYRFWMCGSQGRPEVHVKGPSNCQRCRGSEYAPEISSRKRASDAVKDLEEDVGEVQ